jgi:hypothetical protein
MMARARTFFMTLLSVAGIQGEARAFSDPALFAEAPELGGGGGRWFTGSRLDGYTCAVCHSGGKEPSVTLTGLPESFEPGASYRVTVRWEPATISHAVQLELTDKAGKHASVALPLASDLRGASRCESADDGELATYLVVRGTRHIVGASDCGASEVSFDFVAPDESKLYFNAVVVRSDSSGTPEGDGVLSLRRSLVRRGESTSVASCGVQGTGAGSGQGSGLLLGGCVVASLARSRRRRSA